MYNVLLVKTSLSWSKLGFFLSASREFSFIVKITNFRNNAKADIPAIRARTRALYNQDRASINNTVETNNLSVFDDEKNV